MGNLVPNKDYFFYLKWTEIYLKSSQWYQISKNSHDPRNPSKIHNPAHELVKIWKLKLCQNYWKLDVTSLVSQTWTTDLWCFMLGWPADISWNKIGLKFILATSRSSIMYLKHEWMQSSTTSIRSSRRTKCEELRNVPCTQLKSQNLTYRMSSITAIHFLKILTRVNGQLYKWYIRKTICFKLEFSKDSHFNYLCTWFKTTHREWNSTLGEDFGFFTTVVISLLGILKSNLLLTTSLENSQMWSA